MAVVVMQCMTLVMTVMTRRKTCFLTGVTISPNKAKQTTATTPFCLYLHPLIVKANRGKKHGNSPTSTTIYSVVARTKLYHTTHPIISPITMRNSPGWHSRPLGRVREGLPQAAATLYVLHLAAGVTRSGQTTQRFRYQTEFRYKRFWY